MRQLGSLVRRCASPRPGARTLRWSRPDAPAGRRPWRSGGVRRSWSAVRRYRRRSSSVIRRVRVLGMDRTAVRARPDGPRGRCAGGERLRRICRRARPARRRELPRPENRKSGCCREAAARPLALRFWAQTQLLCATFAGIVAADSRATEKPLGGTGNRKTTEQDIPKPRVLACGCRGRRREERRWWAAEPNATGELDGQVPVSTHSITASADVGVPAVARYSRTIARATSRSRLP